MSILGYSFREMGNKTARNTPCMFRGQWMHIFLSGMGMSTSTEIWAPVSHKSKHQSFSDTNITFQVEIPHLTLYDVS